MGWKASFPMGCATPYTRRFNNLLTAALAGLFRLERKLRVRLFLQASPGEPSRGLLKDFARTPIFCRPATSAKRRSHEHYGKVAVPAASPGSEARGAVAPGVERLAS